MITRHELLRELHRTLGPRNYLEIGVQAGRSLALSRVPSVAIDPEFRITTPIRCDVHLVKATSDEFFARADPLIHLRGGRNPFRNLRRNRPLLGGWVGRPRLDLVFIDGMHLFEYALRDFMNVERHADWWTVIVFDDVLPRSIDEAARERHTTDWTGDVYKVISVLKRYRPGLISIPVATEPTGTLVVLGADADDRTLGQAYEAIVAAEVTPDPQTVPDAIIERHGAVDPGALLASALWRDLVRARRLRLPRARSLSMLRDAADELARTATVGPSPLP